MPLVGGDTAVKRPFRAALAHLWAAGVAGKKVCRRLTPARRWNEASCAASWRPVSTASIPAAWDASSTPSPRGGQRQAVTYEAQAAIEFEAQAAVYVTDEYCFDIIDSGDSWQFDAAPARRDVVADLRNGVECPVIAAKFHNAVAGLIETLSLRLSEHIGVDTIALSGGVFQNATLLGLTMERLKPHDLRVLVHRKVPPNDGGLALGQAVIAHFCHR